MNDKKKLHIGLRLMGYAGFFAVITILLAIAFGIVVRVARTMQIVRIQMGVRDVMKRTNASSLVNFLRVMPIVLLSLTALTYFLQIVGTIAYAFNVERYREVLIDAIVACFLPFFAHFPIYKEQEILNAIKKRNMENSHSEHIDDLRNNL